MKKTYIEYLYPGFFVANTYSEEVSDRNPPHPLPDGVLGFRFFSVTETQVGDEILRGEKNDVGPWTYYGRERTAREIEALPETKENRILKWNVRINKYSRIVDLAGGHAFPLNDGDCVIPPPHGY